jgi:hypothetical protein
MRSRRMSWVGHGACTHKKKCKLIKALREETTPEAQGYIGKGKKGKALPVIGREGQ